MLMYECMYTIYACKHAYILTQNQMFGLPGLLCTLSSAISESSPPLEIFGPVGVRQFVRMSLNLARSQLDYSYVVHELQHDVSTAAYDGMVG